MANIKSIRQLELSQIIMQDLTKLSEQIKQKFVKIWTRVAFYDSNLSGLHYTYLLHAVQQFLPCTAADFKLTTRCVADNVKFEFAVKSFITYLIPVCYTKYFSDKNNHSALETLISRYNAPATFAQRAGAAELMLTHELFQLAPKGLFTPGCDMTLYCLHWY